MVAKFRVSLALQPIATALFANSPFIEGKPTGLLSSRAPTSGPTPTPTAPACSTSCSRTASASRPTPATRSTCRCISSSATAATSTWPASRSATSWTASCPSCRASGRPSRTGPTTSPPSFPEVRLKTLSGDARRRRRPAGAGSAPCRRCGPGMLYDHARSGRGLGPVQGLDAEDRARPARRRRPASA